MITPMCDQPVVTARRMVSFNDRSEYVETVLDLTMEERMVVSRLATRLSNSCAFPIDPVTDLVVIRIPVRITD